MRFFEKSLMTLELPAVLEMLAAEAVGDTAKEQARALTPSVEPAEVRRRQEETTAAKTMMVVRGSPSFSGVKDVRPSLARADLGGALNTRELLDIARVLQCARLVRGYIADDTVGKTPIDHLFYALHANPQYRIDDSELIDFIVNLHNSVQITHACDGIIVLEHDSTSLKHILQRNVGRTEQTASHLLLVIRRFGIDASTWAAYLTLLNIIMQ